jgi:hypothetical protein
MSKRISVTLKCGAFVLAFPSSGRGKVAALEVTPTDVRVALRL